MKQKIWINIDKETKKPLKKDEWWTTKKEANKYLVFPFEKSVKSFLLWKK